MKGYPYLRAYMAGVLLPSWVLVVILAMFLRGHMTHDLAVGLERALIFPMAVVPNVWGLWNVLYVFLHLRGRVPIGIFGALLPVLLVPAGFALASELGLGFYTAAHAAVIMPVLMGVYYLAWKYGVAFFNRIVDLG